ncbi:DUF5131 family protein [Nocardia sp. CY41]|uniref:DUF5131 family protein n=1 Tax=Nocardia sp. CY41 TaxID=2608686 RepID=UPI00135B6B41
MGSASLDDIRKLRDAFATELRRNNRAKKTIDVYLVHLGYFADYLVAEGLPTDASEINGVIVGGESGPAARAMDPDWVRDLCD